MKYIILLLVFSTSMFNCSKTDDFTGTNNNDSALLKGIASDLKGYKIAFGDTRKIYMMNPDGSGVEELADAGPISGYVSWSPDAKYVYYANKTINIKKSLQTVIQKSSKSDWTDF